MGTGNFRCQPISSLTLVSGLQTHGEVGDNFGDGAAMKNYPVTKLYAPRS
jgi:hypothetical protein